MTSKVYSIWSWRTISRFESLLLVDICCFWKKIKTEHIQSNTPLTQFRIYTYSKYILFWIWGHQFTYSEYFNKIFKWWPAVLFCKIWTIIQFMCQGYNILWKKKKLTPLTSVTLISSSLRRITSTLVIYPPPVCLIFSFHVAWFDHALLLFFN